MGASLVAGAGGGRVVRLRRAQRAGVSPVPVRLDALLGPEHLARLVWEVVQRLDLTVTGTLTPATFTQVRALEFLKRAPT